MNATILPKIQLLAVSTLMTAVKNLQDNIEELKKGQKVEELLVMIKGDIEQYLAHLQKLAQLSLNDLLILYIQNNQFKMILKHRNLHIQQNPVIAREIEKRSIYRWNYYWDPNASWLLGYLATCERIILGRSYPIEDIVDIVLRTVKHKVHDHKIPEEIVKNELSHIFKLNTKAFDLNDPRTLIWPLLLMLIPETYYTTWRRKYPYLACPTEQEFSEIYGKNIFTPYKDCAYSVHRYRNPDHQARGFNGDFHF